MQCAEQNNPTTITVFRAAKRHERDVCAHDNVSFAQKNRRERANEVHRGMFLK